MTQEERPSEPETQASPSTGEPGTGAEPITPAPAAPAASPWASPATSATVETAETPAAAAGWGPEYDPATPRDTEGDEPPPDDEPPTARRRGLPPWVPFLLIAIIPAAIVGILVFVLAGNGGSSSSGGAAGIVDGLIRLGPSDQGTVTSYKDQLPPGFSTDFPVYAGAQVVVSESIGSAQGTSYFIVLSTPDAASKVYDFYLNALDKDPWQVEIGRASNDFTGLRFSRPDNADVTGDITLYQSKLDNKTAVFLSYQDVSKTGPGALATSAPFVPGSSRPLPTGFPKDVPIYAGTSGPSTVIDTYFERQPGGQAFVVSFVTKDSTDDVIAYYRKVFGDKGWQVTDEDTSSAGQFAVGINFSDGNAKSIQGSVTADAYPTDSSYNKVDLLVQVTSAHTNGN